MGDAPEQTHTGPGAGAALSDEQITAAVLAEVCGDHRHPGGRFYVESYDTVRLAYEWLDAQRTIQSPRWSGIRPYKHIVEGWAGRYVSSSAMQVAIALHPRFHGLYPHFNIAARLVYPHPRRLEGIAEAGIHPNYLWRYCDSYSDAEGQEVVA